MKIAGRLRVLWLCLLTGFNLVFSSDVRAEDSFPLKDITETIDEILGPKKTDASELAYVSARGVALYAAIALYLEQNAVEGRGDKEMAASYSSTALKFNKVAILVGLKTGKSENAIKEQIGMLSVAYAKEMIRSKQLNNETMSPPIKRDLLAIKKIAPLLVALADDLSGAGSKDKK